MWLYENIILSFFSKKNSKIMNFCASVSFFNFLISHFVSMIHDEGTNSLISLVTNSKSRRRKKKHFFDERNFFNPATVMDKGKTTNL